MVNIAKLNQDIERIQALPDRHLTGLYATLALLTAMGARVNTAGAGVVIMIAFVLVGGVRAVKHHGIIDIVFAFAIGLATGAAALGIVRALAPTRIDAQTSLVLPFFGAVSFTYASAAVSPIVRWIQDAAKNAPKAGNG